NQRETSSSPQSAGARAQVPPHNSDPCDVCCFPNLVAHAQRIPQLHIRPPPRFLAAHDSGDVVIDLMLEVGLQFLRQLGIFVGTLKEAFEIHRTSPKSLYAPRARRTHSGALGRTHPAPHPTHTAKLSKSGELVNAS